MRKINKQRIQNTTEHCQARFSRESIQSDRQHESDDRQRVSASQRVRRALRRYQREALTDVGKRAFPALFPEMRLGKSLICLRSLAIRFPSSGRKLIVGPYSALYQWTKELKAEGLSERDIIFLTGTRKERAENLDKEGEFYLLNKEGWNCIQPVIDINWQSIILDESTFIKNPKSRVSRFFVNNFRNVENRWILTGMPAPESPLDYYQQLKFLDPDILGFVNYWKFRSTCFVQTFRGEYSLTIDGEKFLNERLAKHCYFLSRKDVNLDVEKIFTKRPIRMKVAARKVLQTLYREFIMEDDSQTYDVTDSAGTRWSWMRQICGGFIKKKFIFDDKLKELLELLKGEVAGRQVIIYAEYIHEIIFLSKKLTEEDIPNDYIFGGNREARFDILDAFIAGNFRVLVGQPVCFKHSVDLSNADTIIYYSLPISNETFGQSQDRIINVSTRFPAHIIALTCENTIEDDIYESVINKESKEQLHKRIIRRMQETIK